MWFLCGCVVCWFVVTDAVTSNKTTIATGSKVFFGLILKRNHVQQHKQKNSSYNPDRRKQFIITQRHNEKDSTEILDIDYYFCVHVYQYLKTKQEHAQTVMVYHKALQNQTTQKHKS